MNKSKLYDYIGSRFNHFTVIDVVMGKWSLELLCVCDCGNLRSHKPRKLNNGEVKSCGCHRSDTNKTHGKSRTTEYKSWQRLKDRCLNKNNPFYYLYGGRGIKFCKRWNNFELFLKDMGPKPSPMHSLDRYPNKNGDYKPSNCRWATPQQQSCNLRSNILLTIDSKTLTIPEWAEVSGNNTERIRHRVWRGWSPYDAVFGDKWSRPKNEQNHKLALQEYKEGLEKLNSQYVKNETDI